jgi:hypothetical protein
MGANKLHLIDSVQILPIKSKGKKNEGKKKWNAPKLAKSILIEEDKFYCEVIGFFKIIQICFLLGIKQIWIILKNPITSQ